MSYQTMPPLSGGMPGFVGRQSLTQEANVVSETYPPPPGPLVQVAAELSHLVSYAEKVAVRLDEQLTRLSGGIPDDGPKGPPPQYSVQGIIGDIMLSAWMLNARLDHMTLRLNALQEL